MHDVGHSTFVDPADIPRPRELGMAWEFSPYIWFPTPMAAIDIRKAVDVEPTEVHRTKVEMTFIAGERVYTAGAN